MIVVDETGISMPDTLENQEVWPQTASQKPGCGFPTARICACFSLAGGALLSYAIGNKKNHELPLFRQQWGTLPPGDVFLGDKGFCSYFDIAKLKEQGVAADQGYGTLSGLQGSVLLHRHHASECRALSR
ncbi:transposase [Trichloromonas sp.]|uniref:transposase n=1 Tax=Trichloromonas sp. TaxID=3069249 RepID=UPI002A47BDC4|nr:transposase [Trichloromonas sp.]